MRPTTGTHVYKLIDCRRAVALDLAGDHDRQRPLRPEEELVLQRGRTHEAEFTATLGWPEPDYPKADWAAGAAATERLLRAGTAGVLQGVLTGDERLGIPDLLRREPGASAFGDFHYVVGDVKSAAAPRSDHVLQIAFYSRLLGRLQGRPPDYAYLVLKDLREVRFTLADFDPALDQVLREIAAIRAAPEAVRPFFAAACNRCRWSEVCLPELHAGDDLSLLPGMTRALRATLERAGVATCGALCSAHLDSIASSTALELALLRRLQRAAAARQLARPLPEERGVDAHTDGALVHLLTDAFAERVLWIGALFPATADGTVHDALPASADAEWPAFAGLLRALPGAVPLLHYGNALPSWYQHQAHHRTHSLDVESRFVDLATRLRGAATSPGPVFGLADHVRLGLGRDPHRAGRADAAALHAGQGEAEWLRAKGRSDLLDLAALKHALLAPAGASR